MAGPVVTVEEQREEFLESVKKAEKGLAAEYKAKAPRTVAQPTGKKAAALAKKRARAERKAGIVRGGITPLGIAFKKGKAEIAAQEAAGLVEIAEAETGAREWEAAHVKLSTDEWVPLKSGVTEEGKTYTGWEDMDPEVQARLDTLGLEAFNVWVEDQNLKAEAQKALLVRLEPYKMGEKYNLASAVEAGFTNQELLDAGFSSDAISEADTTLATTVKLGTGERVDKVSYEAMDPQFQTKLYNLGFEGYDEWIDQNYIVVSIQGEDQQIERVVWNAYTPEQQAEIRETGKYTSYETPTEGAAPGFLTAPSQEELARAGIPEGSSVTVTTEHIGITFPDGHYETWTAQEFWEKAGIPVEGRPETFITTGPSVFPEFLTKAQYKEVYGIPFGEVYTASPTLTAVEAREQFVEVFGREPSFQELSMYGIEPKPEYKGWFGTLAGLPVIGGMAEEFRLGTELMLPGEQSPVERWFWEKREERKERAREYTDIAGVSFPVLPAVAETFFPGWRAGYKTVPASDISGREWLSTGLNIALFATPLWVPPMVRGFKAIPQIPAGVRARFGTFPFSEAPGLKVKVAPARPPVRVATIGPKEMGMSEAAFQEMVRARVYGPTKGAKAKPRIEDWPVAPEKPLVSPPKGKPITTPKTSYSPPLPREGFKYNPVTGLYEPIARMKPTPPVPEVEALAKLGLRKTPAGAYEPLLGYRLGPKGLIIPSRVPAAAPIATQVTRIMPVARPIYVPDMPFLLPQSSTSTYQTIATAAQTKSFTQTYPVAWTSPFTRIYSREATKVQPQFKSALAPAQAVSPAVSTTSQLITRAPLTFAPGTRTTLRQRGRRRVRPPLFKLPEGESKKEEKIPSWKAGGQVLPFPGSIPGLFAYLPEELQPVEEPFRPRPVIRKKKKVITRRKAVPVAGFKEIK